jgi:tRNA threonylcarbamoyladenosine biosynthesis protein TsaE
MTYLKMENSRQITHLAQLPDIAQWILAQPQKKIMLYGEMGAGKTTLVQTICRQLGATTTASSPTFSLVNQYTYTDSAGKAALIYHLDLYRLRSLDEALDIGIMDFLDDANYCFIEWAQIIEPLFQHLDTPPLKIMLEAQGEFARKFVIL